jgi:Large eukaryotic DNA virus major capsid protein
MRKCGFSTHTVQYHEVKLHVTFATAAELSSNGIDTSVEPGCSLWMTYVFLDAEERRRFAQTSHEYLIEQVQFTGAETIAPDATTKRTTNVRLNFNHPCKYIAFAAKDPAVHGRFSTVPVADMNDDAKMSNDNYAVIDSVKLTLNGHDRQATKKGSYYNAVVPYETCKSKPAAGVYLYSFCLRPTEMQPSGSANFSRIDNSTLIVTLKSTPTVNDVIGNVKTEEETLATGTALTQLLIYATNFNVLRILSGIGRLYFGRFQNISHLSQTVSCRRVLRENAAAGKQCKIPARYNLLVEFCTEFCNTLDCGKLLRAKSTPPFGKPRVSKQGNDLADRNNDLDWTIRRHSPTCAMTSIRRRLRDYQGVRARGLVIPSDRVRYSPTERESVGNSPGVDWL